MKKTSRVISLSIISCLILTAAVYSSNADVLANPIQKDINASEVIKEVDLAPSVNTTEEGVTEDPSTIQKEDTVIQPFEFEISKEELKKIKKMPFACASPNGTMQAYLRLNDPNETIFDDVIVVNKETGKARVLSLENVLYTTVLSIEWLNDDMIAFKGHVNPSLDVYIVFNPETGERLRENDGVGFTWDTELSHVYYSLPQPHFSNVRGKDKIIEDAETEIYESDADAIIMGGPALSDTGKMFFFERNINDESITLIEAEKPAKGKLKKIKKTKWKNLCGEIKVNSDDSITVETLYSSETYDLNNLDEVDDSQITQ